MAMDLHHGADAPMLPSFGEMDSVSAGCVEMAPRQLESICEENGMVRLELGFLRITDAMFSGKNGAPPLKWLTRDGGREVLGGFSTLRLLPTERV